MVQENASFFGSGSAASALAGEWQPSNVSAVLELLRSGQASNVDLRGSDLSSQDLSGLSLHGASLRGASLVGANLTDVDLGNADLTGARLDGIDFCAQRINLSGARLHAASLRHANLEGCDVAAHQLAGADVSFAKLPDGVDIGRQLKVVEDASKNCRTLFFGVLGGCFFTFLTIGQTNDADLLFGNGISSLPFVGTHIPTLGFYYVAPLILCGLFLYFHLYLQQLWHLVSELPARLSDGTRVDHAIYPWLLTGLTSRYVPRLRHLAQDYGTLRWLASLVTSWLSVPVTLWYVWGRAVARHDPWLSGFQILALLAASLLAVYSFSKMRSTLKSEAGWGTGKDQLAMATWLLGTVVACLLAVACTNKLLKETTTAWHRANAVDPLQAAKDRLYRPAWAQVVGYHPFSVGVRARNVKLAGADLSHFDLRLADLTSADLVGARLTETWLHGANLSGANLDRADLSRSAFVDSDFTSATLNEADLTNADFIDAKGLTEAQIQSACGAGHVRATVEGYVREYWFKLKPCKVVAERLRREQKAAEERARLAKTQAEKAAAEQEARQAKEEAQRAEQQAQQAKEDAKRAAEEEQAKLAVLEKARLKAAREQWVRANPTEGGQDIVNDQAAPPFSKAAAISSLSAAAASAVNCKTTDGPSGAGRVLTTFAPSGQVTSAEIFDPPFASTTVGACVLSKFQKAKVPPFSGSPVSVTKSFVIN